MNKEEKRIERRIIFEVLMSFFALGVIVLHFFLFVSLTNREKDVPSKQELDCMSRQVVRNFDENSSSTLFFEKDGRKLSINSTDMEILYHVASAEAGSTYPQGMKNVVTVILNRLFSDDFPKDTTIHETVFRFRQFSCIMDGNYAKSVVNETVVKAVNEAVYEYFDDTIEKIPATFFANLKICDPKWVGDMEKIVVDTKGDIYRDEAGHSFFIPKNK